MNEFVSQIADRLGAMVSSFPWVVVLVIYVGEKIQQWSLTRILRDALSRAQDAAHAAIPPAQRVPVPTSSATVTRPAASPFIVKPAAPAPPPAAPAPKPPLPPHAETAYDKMWEAMQVSPQHQAIIERDAAKILTNKTRYEGVAQQNGVPWYVIGLIDQMEAGGGCDAHLHNGDPLKGRTIHVPAGRPPAPEEPPFTWEQSSLDALAYEGFDKIKDWSINGIAGALERYNGMGYHSRGVPSPYLWSFSNQYTAGKFVADHVYDPNAVSGQAGALPILKALTAQDPSIQITL